MALLFSGQAISHSSFVDGVEPVMTEQSQSSIHADHHSPASDFDPSNESSHPDVDHCHHHVQCCALIPVAHRPKNAFSAEAKLSCGLQRLHFSDYVNEILRPPMRA